MRKIIIVASDMEIGGAERALLGLLNTINTKEYKIDLFLLRHTGPFLKMIPNDINILPENEFYSDLAVPIENVIKKGHWGMVLARGLGKFKAKRFVAKNHLNRSNSVGIHYSFLYTKKLLPMISEEEYDLAIGFTVPYYLASEKIKAKKKVVWLHTDYSCIDGDLPEEYNVWSAYDNIISISSDVTKGFVSKFPALEKRIIQIENIVSPKMIEKQATEFSVDAEMPTEPNSLKILSIGRFCEAKNFDNVPDICKRLVNMGCDIKWYIIGYGNDDELIQRRITENHMEERVIILGKKNNPYPYLKACDVYVQPSRFEGKSVTVTEAQILHKPVIITNYPTASSQIRNGVDGVIVPLDNEKCANMIKEIIHDKEMMNTLIKNMRDISYSNQAEINKIYNLIKK